MDTHSVFILIARQANAAQRAGSQRHIKAISNKLSAIGGNGNDISVDVNDLPLGGQGHGLGDGGAEVERLTILREPAEEAIALSGGILRLGGRGTVLDVLLRVNSGAAVGIEDHIIVGGGVAPDIRGVLDAGIPACAFLTEVSDNFVEQSAFIGVGGSLAGEAQLDLDLGRLVVLIDFLNLGRQILEYLIVVDDILILAAVTGAPGIVLAGSLDSLAAVDAQVGADGVDLLRPLRRQHGLVGDLGNRVAIIVEGKRVAVLINPTNEVVAVLVAGISAGDRLAVLDDLRLDLGAVLGLEDHLIGGGDNTLDVSDVASINFLPSGGILTVGRNSCIEHLIAAGEVQRNLSCVSIRLIGGIDFQRSGLQGIDHRLIVDGIAILAAIAMRPLIRSAVHHDRGCGIIQVQGGRDGVGLLLPLSGEDHALGSNGIAIFTAITRLPQFLALSTGVGGGIRVDHDIAETLRAPALEDITLAGRNILGQVEHIANEIEIVDSKTLVGVVHRGHVLDIIGINTLASVERDSGQIQITAQLIAFSIIGDIAGRHILLVEGLVQDSPVDQRSSRRIDAGSQVDGAVIDGIRRCVRNSVQRIVVEVHIIHQRHSIKVESADGDKAQTIVAAQTQTLQGVGVQGDGILELCRGQGCEVAVQTRVGVDVVGGDRPHAVQVRPAVHGLAGHVNRLTLAAPVLEGVAGAGGLGSVNGRQSGTMKRLNALHDTLGLAVVSLIGLHSFLGLEVNHVLIVIDHALEVRPAVDGLRRQTGRRILTGRDIGLVDIPQTVIVPAVELIVAGVVFADVHIVQVDDRALQLRIQTNSLVCLAGIAVTIDHKLNGMQLAPLGINGHILGDSRCVAERIARAVSLGVPALEHVTTAGGISGERAFHHLGGVVLVHRFSGGGSVRVVLVKGDLDAVSDLANTVCIRDRCSRPDVLAGGVILAQRQHKVGRFAGQQVMNAIVMLAGSVREVLRADGQDVGAISILYHLRACGGFAHKTGNHTIIGVSGRLVHTAGVDAALHAFENIIGGLGNVSHQNGVILTLNRGLDNPSVVLTRQLPSQSLRTVKIVRKTPTLTGV